MMNRTVFIACGITLFAATLFLAAADNARPWKRLQGQALELERLRLETRLAEAKAASRDAREDHAAALATEEERLIDRRDEIDQLKEDLHGFRGKLRAAELRQNRTRSDLRSAHWRFRATDDTKGELPELAKTLREQRLEIESLLELIENRETKLDAAHSSLTAAKRKVSEARAPIDALERQLERLDSLGSLAFFGLGGAEVKQVSVSPSSRQRTGGDSRERIDRCATCHLFANRDDEPNEDWPRVFRRHPRVDLFLSQESPHPYSLFGCTVCHGGQGRSTDFSRAGHWPVNAEQEADWVRDWEWRREHVGRAMVPVPLIESACVGCHEDPTVLNGGPNSKLDLGYSLLDRLSCTSCHGTDLASLESSPPGPTLLGIAGKTRPAWVYRWLDEPQAFRSPSRMPHFFADASNDATDRERRTAEIRGIVHYLFEHSRASDNPSPAAGDPESGRALFKTIGCAACHLLDPESPADGWTARRQGPNLARIGSKVSAAWLNAWLLAPHSLQPQTAMPDLRLDNEEAANLTAYLMTRRDSAWEALELPEMPVTTRDGLLTSAFERTETVEGSLARLEGMSDREKNNALGKLTIEHYGCQACHTIPGIEPSRPAAPSFANLARRLSGQVTTLATDERPLFTWQPASHQPSYQLGPSESEALTAAVLGLATQATPEADTESRLPKADLTSARRLIDRYGCRSCHIIEGSAGEAQDSIFAPDQTPPDLTQAGARLKSSWLFAYLDDPSTVDVRPWLAARMPSFGLSEAELNTLVRFFSTTAEHDLLTADPTRGASPSAAKDLAVGKVVFGMLQCDSCHAESERAGFATVEELAPAYELARQRLRPDWIVNWIVDPRAWSSQTRMPANFLPADGSAPDSSFLIGSINTPIFAVERQRLLRLFDSEGELHAYLSDPERVAGALRDYLWTLGN